MEEVVVAGRRFVAAKTAAKRVGYHADYVGQLCRSGLIVCEKVGKSWFVWEEDLARHKLATHTKEVSSSQQKKIVNRKDDFTPSRREIVAAIAERARCYPTAAYQNPLRETSRNVNENSSSEFLPPLRPSQNSTPKSYFAKKNPEKVENEVAVAASAGAPARSSLSVGGGRKGLEERVETPTARPFPKQLPSPPFPYRTSREMATSRTSKLSSTSPSLKDVNPESAKRKRQKKKGERDYPNRPPLVIRYGMYTIVAITFLMSLLSIRSTEVCHSITGCETKYELKFLLD